MSKKSLRLLVMMLIICALLTSCAAWNYLSKDEASKEGSDSKGLYMLNSELKSRVYAAPSLTL